MQGVNVFDVLIHNKRAELLNVPKDYLWYRSQAKTTEELEDVLQKANFKFYTIQQEINSLCDLNDRLFNSESEDYD